MMNTFGLLPSDSVIFEAPKSAEGHSINPKMYEMLKKQVLLLSTQVHLQKVLQLTVPSLDATEETFLQIIIHFL